MLDALTESSSKQKNFVQLISDIEDLRVKVDGILQGKDNDIQELKKQLSNAQLRSDTVKQWIDEDKNRFVQELNTLAENNIVLQTSCQVLQERLKILESVERQMRMSVTEDIEVNGIFVSNTLFDSMMEDIVNAGQSMWEAI